MKKPTVSTTVAPARAPFVTDDPAAAYAHFVSAAEALPEDEVVVFRASPTETHKAVRLAVEAITPALPLVAERAPWIDVVSLRELPALSLAVIYAASRVPPPPPSEGEIATKLKSISGLRGRALRYLEVAAGEDLVPMARVRAIRVGTGPLDRARDAVAIAGIFDEFKGALQGCHPFDSEALHGMAADGAWLIAAMTADPTRQRSPEAKTRDRLGTLLAQGCEALRTAGAVAWGASEMRRRIKGLLKNKPRAAKPAAEKKA